jgi:SAM-dependent methyltransferase
LTGAGKAVAVSSGQLYDTIGPTSALTRRTEPRIAAQIQAALADARAVVNVGAGTGSYEPTDRHVVAVEPAAVMRSQRPPGAAPCVAANAEGLPFEDQSFDAAMAVATIHHWPDAIAGLREMQRVARRVVTLTFSFDGLSQFWLTRDYLPELVGVVADLPSLAEMADAVGAQIEPVMIPWDCADGSPRLTGVGPRHTSTTASVAECRSGPGLGARPSSGPYTASGTTSPRVAGPNATATLSISKRPTLAYACSSPKSATGRADHR